MVKTVGQDGRSRTEIVTVGLQPIIDTSTPYEATFLAMLSPEEPGVPHWTHKALASYLQPIFDNGRKQLSREHGRRLAQWCGAGVAQSVEQPPCEREVAGSTPAAGTTDASLPNGVKTAKQRAQEIAAAFSDAPTLEALLSTEERVRADMNRLPDSAKATLAKLFHERREVLPRPTAAPSARTFADERAELEGEEWKQREGRDEDERQQELLG